MQSTHLNKKAFALSLVLWIVAALLFGATTLAILAKDTLFLTKGVDNKLKTELMVEDALESLKFYITTANFDNSSFINNSLNDFKYKFPTRMVVDNRWYSLNKNVQIRVQDTTGLLNILTIDPKAVALMATKASQDQLHYVISDSIEDWIDKDDIVSLNGAEASHYNLIEHKNFKIRNSKSIQNVAELRLINGIDKLSKVEWLKLKEKLYYGNGNIANLMLVNDKYLAFLLDIDLSDAQDLIAIRESDKDKYVSLISSLKSFNDDSMGFYLSKELKIKIKASLKSSTTILNAIIDFKEDVHKQYTVIKIHII